MQKFKHLFIFNKRDRNGIILLLIILCLVISFQFFSDFLIKKDSTVYNLKFDLYDSTDNSSLNDGISEERLKNPQNVIYEEFDPNTIQLKKLLLMGLNEFQAKNLIKYRNNGGEFYKKEDIKKIYGIDEKLYLELERYIVFSKKEKGISGLASKPEINEITTKRFININKSKHNELYKLGFLDTLIANRIIKYRDFLGGFYTCNQLYEVYGIDSIEVQKLCEIVKIDTKDINRIQINSATFNDLLKIPEISKYEVNAILSYRKGKKISSFQELLDNKIIDTKIAKTASYYVDFQ